MLPNLLYIVSWLIVFGSTAFISFKLVKSALVYFFGVRYRVHVRDDRGHYHYEYKRIRNEEELESWVMENYARKDDRCNAGN